MRLDRRSKTNFQRKKKNGALPALRGHRTRTLAGILGDIGSYVGGAVGRRVAPPSSPEELDQAPHLLIFLRKKSLLKPAKPSADRSHCNGLAFSIVDWIYLLAGDLTAPTLADSRTMAEAYASAAADSPGGHSRPCAGARAAR